MFLVNKGCDLVAPESLYTIKTDKEIAHALYWDIDIINGDCVSLVEYLGLEKVSEDTSLIKLLCSIPRPLFLMLNCYLILSNPNSCLWIFV